MQGLSKEGVLKCWQAGVPSHLDPRIQAGAEKS